MRRAATAGMAGILSVTYTTDATISDARIQNSGADKEEQPKRQRPARRHPSLPPRPDHSTRICQIAPRITHFSLHSPSFRALHDASDPEV